MTTWIQRLRGERDAHEGVRSNSEPSQPTRSMAKRRQRLPLPDLKPPDPNTPLKRLQLHQRCLYERTLPGNAFVSAHVNRLQHGYYASRALHEGTLNNVYFVSVHFVFHPRDHHAHRIRSATIKVSIHSDFNDPNSEDTEKGSRKFPRSTPRILKHAPELIFGAVSPENLQWNFNLSSSLGVSQAPLSATLNPSGGVKKTYRVYDMMSIQGSLRVLKSPMGTRWDADDAMAVWTLEENQTQRSGLPREFDFVLLVHRPDEVGKVFLSIDVDATITSWHGDYPEWYTNLSKYLPNVDLTLDMDTEIGQRFLPERPGRGFNFADLPQALDQYVCMPGTMYPTSDREGTIDDSKSGDRWSHYRDYHPMGPLDEKPPPTGTNVPITDSPVQMSPTRQRQSWSQPAPSAPAPFTASFPTSVPAPMLAPQRQFLIPETLNVRVTLEHATAQSISPSARRHSFSPITPQEPGRQPSIRRRRSRSELKEYGVQQALHALRGEEAGLPKEQENGRAMNGAARVSKVRGEEHGVRSMLGRV